MGKSILISAFVLASVSAQAGQGRGLVLASNDQPTAATSAETAKPEETKAPEAKDIKADAATPEASKPQPPRSKKVHARHYEGDEAKARRIAARYGVYW